MAALTADQIQLVYKDGVCGLVALFALKNVTAADTLDLVATFKLIKRAGIVSGTGTTIAACTVTGATGLTIPTGPLNDGVWLLVAGVAV